MNNNHESFAYEGGCHCGTVRFRIVANQRQVYECNCSICRKKAFLHLIVPSDKFTLLKGAENLSTYTFNTHIAKHFFCRTCGINSFYRPRSHPKDVSVNLHCLDGDVLSDFEVIPFDGANWEANID